MEQGCESDAGGIARLRGLIRDHSEAIERDLIGLGLRLRWLGTDRLTWRDLLVIVAAAKPGDAIFHAVHPDEPYPEQIQAHSLQMLRSVEYSLQWLQWAKTEDGPRGINAPEPARFPWERSEKYAADSMTLQEALDFAGWSSEMDAFMRGGS